MDKKPLAVVLGITGNLGFAAGCALQALRRHSPNLGADILVYTDDALADADAALLREAGALLLPYTPVSAGFLARYVRLFSLLALAKLECFRLLERYRTVIWIDADTAVQDDIGDLAGYGPLAIALEDPHFSPTGKTMPASINVTRPLPGLKMDEPNLNTGVVVFQDTLPDPGGLYRLCIDWVTEHAAHIKYMDQPALNMVAQDLRRRSLFTLLPHERFNAHPRNPAAQTAAIVHAFGAYKMWDDGMLRCAFPEWDRDYRRWMAKGGAPNRGNTDNMEFLEGGAFFMFNRLYESIASAQSAVESMETELVRERALRERFESIARKMP